MRANEFIQISEMAASPGGLDYELVVLKSVKSALEQFKGQAEFVHSDILSTAGFSNVGVDLEVTVDGKPFAVEIKQNAKAQMGGTSIIYDIENDIVKLRNPEAVNQEVQDLFIQAAKLKRNDFVAFVDYLRKQSPQELHKNLSYKVPVGTVTKQAWESAKKAGLLKRLNVNIQFDSTDMIAKHYNKKGVFYIQIGGAGLFYLNNNPLNLPIPKFEGQIQVELRLGIGGSVKRIIKNKEYSVVGGGYRVQARLQSDISSQMSLDNVKHVSEVFQYIIDHNKNSKKLDIKKLDDKKIAVKKTPAKKTTDFTSLKAINPIGTLPKATTKT